MKIYSSKTPSDKIKLFQELARQDVWVRVTHTCSPDYPMYVKIIDVYLSRSDYLITMQSLPLWWTDIVDGKITGYWRLFSLSNVLSVLNNIRVSDTVFESNISVCDPLDTKTTQEMIGILDRYLDTCSTSTPESVSKLQLLHEICGEDIWLNIIEDGGYTSFTKILNIYNNVITVNQLPLWWTDYISASDNNIERSRYNHIDYSLQGLTPILTLYTGDFVVSEPVELMTTEEMREVLDSCTVIDD